MMTIEKIKEITESKGIVLKLIVPIIAVGVILFGITYWEISNTISKRSVKEQVEKAALILNVTEASRELVARQNAEAMFSNDTSSKKNIYAKIAKQHSAEEVMQRIPIFSAMSILKEQAREFGYHHKVAREGARNPLFEADEEEQKILALLAASRESHWYVDTDRREVVYARPITLTEDCLLCHGSPSLAMQHWNRPDGKDILGYRMEGKQNGDMFGAFILRMPLEEAYQAAAEESLYLGGIIVTLVLLLLILVLWVVQYLRKQFLKIATMQRKVREGDLKHRLQVNNNDEIGAVMKGFNLMVDAIEDGVEKLRLEKKEVDNKIAKAIEDKNTLINILAHDLKNPVAGLNLVIGNMQRYRQKMTELQMEATIERMHKASEKIGAIINNVLTINSLDKGNYISRKQLVDVSEMIENIVQNYEEQIKQKEMSIVIEKGLLETTMKLDVFAVEQVLENLISNAVKYTYMGGKIYVKYSKTGKNILTVQVSDTGQGIAEEELPLLFQEYRKLSSRPTGGESSHGVGLAIVKRLIEAIKGKIYVQSEKGKGTTFTVEVPVQGVKIALKEIKMQTEAPYCKMKMVS